MVFIFIDAKLPSLILAIVVLTTSLWRVVVPVAHFISLNGNAFDAAGPAVDDIQPRQFWASQLAFKIAFDFINHIAKGFVIVHIEAIDNGLQIIAPQQSAVMLLRDGLKRTSVFVRKSPHFIDIQAIDGKALWGKFNGYLHIAEMNAGIVVFDCDVIGLTQGDAVDLGDVVGGCGIHHELSHGRMDVVESVYSGKVRRHRVVCFLAIDLLGDVFLMELGDGFSQFDGLWPLREGADVGSVVVGEIQQMCPSELIEVEFLSEQLIGAIWAIPLEEF